MAKYITSISDLTIQAINNKSEVVIKAKNGNPEFCFKMGMIHLLGINTPIDFKKASQFFCNQSLSDVPDVKLILGFIAECEGDFSSAFQYYASSESGEKDSYIEKVIKGRNNLQVFFQELDLPLSLNKEVSSILNEFIKTKTSRTGACVKIAAICNDEQTCLEAAKNLYNSKGYISAIQWLKKGNIPQDNPLYIEINKVFSISKKKTLDSKELQVITIKGNSLLSSEDPTSFLNKIQKTCDAASKKCSMEWAELVQKNIKSIIKKQKDKEERERLAALAEEEANEKKRKRKYKFIGIIVLLIIAAFLANNPFSDNQSSIDSDEEECVLKGNIKFHGDVDGYPITMELQIEGERIKGWLYYDRYGPENKLYLSGSIQGKRILLDETDANGKYTGVYSGSYSDGVIEGKYKNLKKVMPFRLTELY